MAPVQLRGHDSRPRRPAPDVGNRMPRQFPKSFLESLPGVCPHLTEPDSNQQRFLTIFGPFRPARVLAPEGPLWQEPPAWWAAIWTDSPHIPGMLP